MNYKKFFLMKFMSCSNFSVLQMRPPRPSLLNGLFWNADTKYTELIITTIHKMRMTHEWRSSILRTWVSRLRITTLTTWGTMCLFRTSKRSGVWGRDEPIDRSVLVMHCGLSIPTFFFSLPCTLSALGGWPSYKTWPGSRALRFPLD